MAALKAAPGRHPRNSAAPDLTPATSAITAADSVAALTRKPASPERGQYRTHHVKRPGPPDPAQAEEMHSNDEGDPGHGELVSIQYPINDHQTREQATTSTITTAQ